MNAKLFPLLTTLLAAGAAAGAAAGSAQELQPFSQEDLAKATPVLIAANAKLGDGPMKLDLAPDQATGFRAGDVGAIFIPDQRLKAEKRDKNQRSRDKRGAMYVGQLWTSKLAPKVNATVVGTDRLRLVNIVADNKELELAVYALRIEKAGKKEMQLALYAKDNSPVLRVPLTAEKSKGAAPVVFAARRTGEEDGVLELKILGRYKAEIPVARQVG
ncbi:MAG: hypothetical protein FJ399_06900 [Verrucomicrobia bacterium]|nr:hypothetical protein [Verrucomicrobiota bacterium]